MTKSRPRLTAALVPITVGAAAAVVVAFLGGSRPMQLNAPLDATLVPISAGLTVALGPSLPAPAAPTVVVDCAGHDQVRPAQFTLTCADGNSQLQRGHWQRWDVSAYGAATWWVNDCLPTCYQGHAHRFAALAVLWRSRPLPGHAGEHYFTRLTVLLPGKRCYTAQHKHVCYPDSQTTDLWSRGP